MNLKVIMKSIYKMTDRELLEFVFASQTILMGKVNRIEEHLKEAEPEKYRSRDLRHHSEVYEDLKTKVEEVHRQINALAE